MKGCGCCVTCVPWLGPGAGVASGDSRRMVHDTVNRGGDVVSTSSPGIAHSLSRNEDTSASSPIFTPEHHAIL